MENGWQMKCGVKLANSSTRAPPCSEQIQLQESSNQRMNMNTSHCILPHDAREQGPLNPQVKQAPTSNTLNFGSYKPINPESGFLFHSLLSAPEAPESLLQYDFQRHSSMHSSGGVCIPDTSAQGIVGTMPTLSLLQNRSNFNTRAGVDVRPIFQPGRIMNANNGNTCGISDDLDTLRAFVTPAGPRHETGVNTPLQKGVNCASSGSSNLLDASLQTSSSLIKKENSVLSGCPRVFCVGACGDLLLSSTGLFGILCSCHGMHMSVSKFCEHSGLSDVNPGYAVRVDSGESIAHWRKLYLQKFGIRAPGDHRGWDWPEGFLATSGLANSSMAVAGRRKVFDLSSLFNSSAESPAHVQNNLSASKPRSTQPNQIQWGNNGCDHYKMSSFSSNLHNTTDNTTIACPSPRSFTPPLPSGNGGSGDSCQSRSFHFVSSGQNSFNSAFQNLQGLSVGSKVKSNLKDDVVVQRGTIPSSIELKLGQPSQLSWSSGSTSLSADAGRLGFKQSKHCLPSAVRPHTNCVQTTTVHEKPNCNLENAEMADRNKEHIFCHATSDFSRTKEPFQAGPLNNASISFQAVQALTSTKGTAPSAHMEHLGDGLHNTFAISTLVPPSSATVGRSLYHKKITKRMTNGHSFSPWALHHQPHVDRSVLIDFSCNKDPPIRPPDSNKLASLNNKSRTLDETSGHKESHVDSDLSSRLYAKQMESSGFPRAGKTCNPNTSALFPASSSCLRMEDVLSNVSVAPHHIGNTHTMASNLDQHQFSSKLKNSSISFTTIPVVPTTSTSFSPLSAVLTPGHGSVSFSKNVDTVNSRASEECMKFLPLGKEDKSFNEKPMDASLVYNTQPGIHFDQRQQNKNCGMSDLGPQGLFPGQRSFEGQRLGRPLSGGHTVSPSFFSDGHKKCLDLGAISEEMTSQSELTVKYNEDPCNPQKRQQSLSSGGRQENMECGCNMVQGCDGGSSSQISNRCNGNVQTLCSKREQESGSRSFYGLKKQESAAVVETPKYNGSRFSDDISTGKVIPVDCSHQVKELHFKSDCGNSQWINLPSQVNAISKLKCTNAPIHNIGTREAAEACMKEHAVKPAPRTNQVAELLEGKESSDISSGCSAPVVTHASNEVNMVDCVTVDACHTMCNSNQIADQGSAISRSCSSVEGLEAIDSVRSSQLDYDGKTRSTEEESLMVLENAALHSMMNESKQTYPKSNELQNFTLCGGNSGDMSNNMQNENKFNPRKRKRTNKWKALGKPFTVPEISLLPSESQVCASATNHHAPTEDVPELLKPNLNSTNVNVNSSYKSLKRRRSALSSVKTLYHNPDLTHLNGIDNSVEVQLDDQLPLVGNDDSVDMAKNAAITNMEQVKPADAVRKKMKDTVAGEGYWLHNSISDGNMKRSSKGCQKLKPVACGKYGIIYDHEFDVVQLKPPKIVPLSQVLKASKRNAKSDKSVSSTRRKKCGGKKWLDVSFRSNRSQVKRYNKARLCHSQVIDQETQRMHLDNTQSDDLVGSVGIGVDGDERNLSVSTSCSAVLSKPKEIRMRSLHELSMRGNKFISADISHSQNVMYSPPTVCGLEMITPKNTLMGDGGASRAAGKRFCRKPHCSSLISEAEGLCCVCGISNEDNANSLLECGHCLIRIHQACYGIARVPKGDWYCRPCRTSSKDVACVLCGYGGGAMTRAFGSRNVVKSLLKAWDIRTEPNIMSVGSAEALYVPAKMERRDSMKSAEFNFHPSIEPVVHNSIVTGLFDTTVKQWVHMVCGLWTPGTRCPNVDTMSAFDVSGVSHLNEHMVCYICNRAGGSCIRCRVETCYTHFHPWCAHHKGLLQSEVEGVDSDQVGFYGRCLLHANPQASHSENHRDTDKLNSEPEREEEPTCARTEGYKGKKQRVGHYSSSQYSGKGGCLVTQVQLDAWLYINRHKLRWNKQPKPPLSDVDHDYRKEYTRYKQAKGWKHLVVYKSGIHALGLYTSQLFQRGAMVVEYVGEIVGHRVADKRETEYMSGRKLQYKSACYFFRIDKEQIIDATCKGGIARFVNHSCQPNCVAKVLTIRGDKKVVFFAQRDIFPGEEITYDYHFNHEDEGKKIPCFCNSKNCRRYLN